MSNPQTTTVRAKNAHTETTLQKLNWLAKRGWQLVGKGTGKVFYKTAPYRREHSINDAINLEGRMEALWLRNQ